LDSGEFKMRCAYHPKKEAITVLNGDAVCVECQRERSKRKKDIKELLGGGIK